MAGDAVAGDVVVAASTSGDVAAVRVPADRGGRSVSWLWRARFGPVYRRPGVSRDGRTLFVPSADRHLYALDASTGLVGWRFAADAPVLSQPLVTPELVVFTAGERLLAVHATSGELAWAVPGRGFSAGRAGCDGERVYTAAADGFARAHDLRTGREAWSHRMVSGDLHRVTLYSGWDDVIALGAGVVLAATVSGTQALEAATGAPRWTLPGSTMYPPTVVLGDGTALFATERGLLSRVGLADGGAVWQADLGVGVQNAGLAVAGDSAWVATADGRLVRVRLADGREQGAVRYTLAQCFSAPAVTGDTLVAGDQGGVVHGLRLPAARVLPDERVQGAERGVGLLQLRQVPGLADDRELRLREGRGQGLPVPGHDDAVAVTPEHQDRDLYPAEPTGQPGVVHVRVAGEDAHGRHVGGPQRGLLRRHGGRVDVEAVGVVERVLGHAAGVEREEVADRLSLDQHADRVDQDQAADQPGLVAHGHLGADPATDGRADDQHVLAVLVPEQAQVGGGQVTDRGEPRRAGRAVPARMDWRKGVHGTGQVGGDALYGGRAAAAVQDQRGAPGSGLGQGNLGGPAGAELDGADAGSGHESVSVPYLRIACSVLSGVSGWTSAIICPRSRK